MEMLKGENMEIINSSSSTDAPAVTKTYFLGRGKAEGGCSGVARIWATRASGTVGWASVFRPSG